MPGGVLPYQENYVRENIISYMKSFDLRIGTLECAIGNNMEYDQSKMDAEKNIIYARDEDFYRVKELGIDVVSLANNHIYDLGEAGLRNTIELLKKSRIGYLGAGLNEREASAPFIIEKNSITIALFACCFIGLKPVWVTAATPTSAGIWQTDIETICQRIKEAKMQYDYVIVMPHWGIELSYYPPLEYYQYAQRMVDAGADSVLGSHTHTIGPYWKYKNKPICYSMGNFLFPDFCMEEPKPQFYPIDVNQYQGLERRWFYPNGFSSPVVSVWRGRNRIGSMVEMRIGKDGLVSKAKLSILSKNNVLERYLGLNSMIVSLRMRIWSIMYSHFDFRFVDKVLRSRYNLIRRVLNRSKAFNVPVEL